MYQGGPEERAVTDGLLLSAGLSGRLAPALHDMLHGAAPLADVRPPAGPVMPPQEDLALAAEALVEEAAADDFPAFMEEELEAVGAGGVRCCCFLFRAFNAGVLCLIPCAWREPLMASSNVIWASAPLSDA
jgi:hypothetical protein